MITSNEARERTEKAIERDKRETQRLNEEAEEKAKELLSVVDEAVRVAAEHRKYSAFIAQRDLIGDDLFELSEEERQRVNKVILPCIAKLLTALGFKAIVSLEYDITVSWAPSKDDRLPMDDFQERDKWGKVLTKRW
jgi:hypothetical protein